ncbi:hypothetical protein LEP1GSC188_2944 [Leptospira weilii serovar Topaz str. LT2116]|uniref:Uncharacterized protein n=1 Tax=Leptospira weilii serovar Topaz str. LT2116 TaxID=1088540 RepID=M3H0Y7_9LEPT|nr:hypothetical protein LEP1GSC188_2944 [Leptospira weilii serovar Topaz str. LT2116]
MRRAYASEAGLPNEGEANPSLPNFIFLLFNQIQQLKKILEGFEAFE